MAVYRKRPCPDCDGHGFKCVVTDYSASSETCLSCNGTGYVDVAITNSERIRELSLAEQVRFFRGFNQYAKYSEGPAYRLLHPEESDDDLIEWLNKVSDHTDDCIFYGASVDAVKDIAVWDGHHISYNGDMISLKLLEPSERQDSRCYFCGSRLSVKYSLELSDSVGIHKMPVCNRCALEYVQG